MRDLSRWLDQEGLEPGEVSGARLDEYLRARRAAGCRRYLSERSLAPLLGFLRDRAVVPAAPAVGALEGLEGLLIAYHDWLVGERDLAAKTVLRYDGLARRFLEEAAGEGGVEALSAADVTAFLVRECSRYSVGSAKGRATELRSLLRFLYVKGFTAVPLAAAVPGVAGWTGVRLPVAIGAEQVRALIGSCDRTRVVGRRDFAILTLLGRLGLRSGEIAGLGLGDIDWRAGEIVVRGKGRRSDRLPLPADVGEALAGYVADGRPRVACREVFVRGRAPLRGIHPTTVSTVVRHACVRVGLPVVGAHRLRHAAAAEMLARGAPLAEIGQVLRHRDPATTALYAKVDLGALRMVAQPWPGATS
jgi:integrase